jgi:multisubunit Na+/H+ antiporter MnhE subunit
VRLLWRLALLVTLWLLAWGDISLVNILSGTAVAGALLLAFPARRRRETRLRFSAQGILRLAAYVAVQLTISNIVMIRQILRRRPGVNPGVVTHRLQTPSEEVATLMTSIIALSPGTMTADITDDSSVIYVHIFQLNDPSAAHASLEKLERLVLNAIATDLSPRGQVRAKEQP